ncbi:hypothetical protein IC757_00775 [Wenzhouxiangella sp. AB-CW3]|uniref:hypothetical protein n=1 Tax=Wenzhouxiangella sp. AB-CW3 TaxID=2771012 RepID=UPI00168B6AF0|nr:hypothetical protein [Wenzhouxiangella sp. AB-CW3]QOC22734.1 hypothetical protein IC757_00775 [Wenzhouxiangella sp. AB-CW3]
MDGSVRVGGQRTRIVAWSLVLVVAVLVLLVRMFPPIPGTLAVAEPVDGDGNTGYVYLAGQWYDLDGHPLPTTRDQELSPRMLAPLRGGDLLVSHSNRSLWRCRAGLIDCRPWAKDLDLGHRFQAVEMDDGHVVLLSLGPDRLYLLDAAGEKLDSRSLQSSRTSLTRRGQDVFLSVGSPRQVRSMTVSNGRFGEPETMLDLSERSPVSGYDLPHRLRRVGEHWWLGLLNRADRIRFAVLDDDWELIDTHAVRVDGRITDWSVDDQGQLLLASNRHKLFRHDLSSRQSTLLFQGDASLVIRLHDNFVVIMVALLLLLSIGMFALVIRAKLHMEPMTTKVRESLRESLKTLDAEGIASMQHDGPVWLSAGKKVSRRRRWTKWQWKLAPVWVGATLVFAVLIVSRVYEQSESVLGAGILVISMIFLTIQGLVESKRDYDNSQYEPGVQGQALLLQDPAGRVRRYAGSDLLFDGDTVLAGQTVIRLFEQHVKMSSSTLHDRRFLYEPAKSQISLQPVLEAATVVTSWALHREASRRRGNRWLTWVVIASMFAVPFTSFL